MQNNEQLYTLVDNKNRPVYTDMGMDGHFALCDTLGSMMTFTKKHGYSQMMELARWSQDHNQNGRMAVFPARVNLIISKIGIES